MSNKSNKLSFITKEKFNAFMPLLAPGGFLFLDFGANTICIKWDIAFRSFIKPEFGNTEIVAAKVPELVITPMNEVEDFESLCEAILYQWEEKASRRGLNLFQLVQKVADENRIKK